MTAEAIEQTCGEEVAESAEVPRRWQALMDHVAGNVEQHATWVGVDSPAARREHDALMRVADEYRAMASAAGRAAAVMAAMRDLEMPPHDPARLDRADQARRMRVKIELQRALIALLSRHADESERALAELERPR